MTTTLEQLRTKIDQYNMELLVLLNLRAEVVVEIGMVKEKLSKEIFDAVREQEILNRIFKNNKGPLNNDMLKNIFKTIFDESSKLQQEESKKHM